MRRVAHQSRMRKAAHADARLGAGDIPVRLSIAAPRRLFVFPHSSATPCHRGFEAVVPRQDTHRFSGAATGSIYEGYRVLDSVWSLEPTCTGYRLPTSDEWTALAVSPANILYSGSNDADEVAWWGLMDGPKPVGHKKPNEWGLYDMSGNVMEWVWDEDSEQGLVTLPRFGRHLDKQAPGVPNGKAQTFHPRVQS